MRHDIRAIHFIGIGGSGMAGLAEVMAGMGYQVSGSDVREQASVARLRARGIAVHIGHAAAHVEHADCAVYSSAIGADNAERRAALQRGIPVVPRAQMLGELMRFKPGIAVAGTHGKTTVSSMVASVLHSAGGSPTCVIGGRLLSPAAGELLGDGKYVVVEADESDSSFLHLQPEVAVVTNIDNDHLEAFADDMACLSEAFATFLGNLPFYGTAVLCSDNAAVEAIASRIEAQRVVRYGLDSGADIAAEDIRARADGMDFTLSAYGERHPMRLGVLGMHNVQNALAAAAVALEVGVPVAEIQKGLEAFAGVGRRLEFYGDIAIGGRRALLADDYAHHPSEISATLAALRAAYPNRRLQLVFQPHRYSRTSRLMQALAQALSAADGVILLPIYSAGEAAPSEDLDAMLLAAIETDKAFCAQPQAQMLAPLLEARLGADDVLLCMGAGDVGALPPALWEQYRA